MEIYREIQPFDFRKPVVTTGFFDGVHVGHKELIKSLLDARQGNNKECVVVTFWPHPRWVSQADSSSLKLINTLEEKIEILSSTGIDHLVIIPFTPEFAAMSADEFITNILVDKIGVDHLVVGYNHQFGANREGNLELLRLYAEKHHFKFSQVNQHKDEQYKISSTTIRNLIHEGKIAEANKLLGYPFSFKGTVIQGKEIGRKIGFPTANLNIKENFKIIPGKGVYAIKLTLDKEYIGMLSIGTNPTVNKDENMLYVEVHILNFNDNLYGKQVTVRVYEKIRDELVFDNLQELQEKIAEDKTITLRYFQAY